MNFKNWLNNESIGTSVFNGGVQVTPGENLNTNMPVRSKISTNDGATPKEKHSKINPDKLFGFRNLKDKNRSLERML